MEAVDRAWPAASRVDTLLSSRRKAIAVWTDGVWRLRLIYDQRSPSGQYSDLLEHYLNLCAVLRPDVRLILQGPERRVELYVDAKLSERPQYLRGSLHKMISYLADRPGVFLPRGPRGRARQLAARGSTASPGRHRGLRRSRELPSRWPPRRGDPVLASFSAQIARSFARSCRVASEAGR
jgi:hypothetical protein